MELTPSKFINKETISYLQAQAGATIPQRIEELTVNAENTIKYLQDYDDYLSTSLTEIQEVQTYQRDSIKRMQVIEEQHITALTHLRDRINAQQKALKVIFIIASAAILIAFSMGVRLWLAK